MRLAIFVCLFLACLAFAKAQSFRPSRVQEFLDNYPILIKETDMIDIAENENFSFFPKKETQFALPGKKYKTGKMV